MSSATEMSVKKKLSTNQVFVKSVGPLCVMCVKKGLYLQKI